jgi:hypothetical protein
MKSRTGQPMKADEALIDFGPSSLARAVLGLPLIGAVLAAEGNSDRECG